MKTIEDGVAKELALDLIAPSLIFVLLLVSAFTPWLAADFESLNWQFGPMSTASIAPTSICLLLLALFSMFFLRRHQTAKLVFSLACSIWAFWATTIWLFAGQARNVLPFETLSEGLLPNTYVGVYAGMLAGLLAIQMVLGQNRRQTRSFRLSPVDVLKLAVALGLLIAARETTWYFVQIRSVGIEVKSDVVPGLGIGIGFAIITTAVFVVISVVGRARWAAHGLLVSSVLLTLVGLLSLATQRAIGKMYSAIAGAVGVDSAAMKITEYGAGPWIISLAGFVALSISTVSLLQLPKHERPHSESIGAMGSFIETDQFIPPPV